LFNEQKKDDSFMTTLRLVLGDQLSCSLSTLSDCAPEDVILMCEVPEEATYVPHHKKKIAFLFAAMRHFAEALRQKNHNVRYIKLDDPDNTGSFEGELLRAIEEVKPTRCVMCEASEYRVLQKMKQWQSTLALPVEIREDDRFLASHATFKAWAKGKKQLRMEYFYRDMRKQHKLLMEPDGTPTGGVWNYDKENRKPPKAGLKSPKRISHKKLAITQEVLRLVKERFANHFGDLEPFHFAVTHEQAMMELQHFIDEVLPSFGDYQDAMVAGEPYLYHSLISAYLNAGLLLPLEICQRAEQAYRAGKAPLNAVEGFIRQILGWREYIRGIYWAHMPAYGEQNYLEATTPLPSFYWTGETKMFCMAETVRHTREHAYSHHIQRLMVTGNFALLAGLDVKEVQAWYLAVYADAYEWVEMPNTLGMALFGDGGLVASKPYAASGKYIKRMSNYCKNCYYDPELSEGEKACPFNALYWAFMLRHEDKFRGNPRLPFVFNTWDKFSPEKQQATREQAAATLQKMGEGEL
jgi:deoxyribodipyrimidine photolyase-related protein